jgi:hypothetical protein
MRKAGDIITALFKENFGQEFMETARQNAGLFSSWKAIVAEAWPLKNGALKDELPPAAVHSQIAELERGVLLVEADHPGWIQILQTRQREILAAVQRRFPQLDVLGIAFRLSRKPFVYQGQEEREPANEPVENNAPVKTKSPADTEIASGIPACGRDVPKDEEFDEAFRELEEIIKKRNGL